MRDQILKTIGIIAVLPLIFLYSVLTSGWIFYKFYHWFVYPAFNDMPSISFYTCIGLATFITLFKSHDTKKDERKTNWAAVIVYPWVTLLFGWLTYLFIK